MIDKLKAWFRAIVAEEVRKAVSAIEGDIKQAVEAHIVSVFATERKSLDDLHAELKQAHADSVKEFEQKVYRTRPDGSKGETAHWKAPAEDVKADHQLRHPIHKRR